LKYPTNEGVKHQNQLSKNGLNVESTLQMKVSVVKSEVT